MKKVLIADDLSLIRFGLENIVKSLKDFEVCYLANNGEKAIKGIIDTKPDLIILDISMPNKSGIEVLEFVKQNNEYKSIKVIMHSIHSEYEMIEKCRILGAEGYLFKDATDDEIRTAITKIMVGEKYYSETAQRLEKMIRKDTNSSL